MPLNVAPTFGKSSSQPLAQRVNNQSTKMSMRSPMVGKPMGMNMGMGMHMRGMGGTPPAPNLNQNRGMNRIQAPPLMDSGMGGGMIADNAPSMAPPMMANSPGMMMPQQGPLQDSGGGELGNIFGRYPRTPDPRFRY